MPMKTIFELRILPPFAIGRLGSSPEPMDNYKLEIPAANPLGRRQILPDQTLVVDRTSGEIARAAVPHGVRFKDAAGRIRPVAPFFELWARFEADGPLLPLTTTHLSQLGLTSADIQWSVQVANIKVFRRTGDPSDQVEARVGPFHDHTVQPLRGHCANFLPGATLPLGDVQYIKPTTRFPQIRLRFTPAHGKVYGPKRETPTQPNEPAQGEYVIEVYDATRGKWKGYADPLNDRRDTNPAQIYAGYVDATNPASWISRGFLDDECDGIIEAQLTLNQSAAGPARTLAAFARIACGPPTFAPDSQPVRTVGDELEQAMYGPDAQGSAAQQDAEDIVRRAVETVRLMNTDVMNRPDAGMARMDNLDLNRAKEPILDPAVVDQLAIRGRHERVLLALESGTLAWFARMLREYNEVGDVSNEGRRKMPAMMRGADARHLALTRRQVSKVRAAAKVLAQSAQPADATEGER